jgi:hypothetical protein
MDEERKAQRNSSTTAELVKRRAQILNPGSPEVVACTKHHSSLKEVRAEIILLETETVMRCQT